MSEKHSHTVINEILPKAGLVYSEKGNLSEVLCKPKIMPLKSATLQKLETAEKNIEDEVRNKESSWTTAGFTSESSGSAAGQGNRQVTSAEVMSFD